MPGAVLAAALLAGAARAESLQFTVNFAQDLPDANPGDGIADADLDAPGEQTSLRAAVMEANAVPGADSIVVPDGVWKLSLKGVGFAEDGDLDVSDDLTIVGTAADPETGKAGTIIDARKLKDRVFDLIAGKSLVLRNLTLRNAKTPAVGIDEQGGALRSAGSLELEKVILLNCHSAENGGAIAVMLGVSTLTLTDVLIAKSSAVGDGGGVWVQGGQVTAVRTTWQSCKSTQGKGGGLAIEKGTQSGGGIGTLTNVTFSGNSAKLDGGAIVLSDVSVLTITNATLAGNVCKATAGLASIPNMFQVQNTVLMRNTLLDNKGLRNVTPDSFLISLGGNLDSGTSAILGAGDLSDTKPFLLKLKNWGGFTPTRALKSTSPAIDHGTDSSAPTTDQRGVARVDIPDVGELALVDCGAFEYTAPDY